MMSHIGSGLVVLLAEEAARVKKIVDFAWTLLLNTKFVFRKQVNLLFSSTIFS